MAYRRKYTLRRSRPKRKSSRRSYGKRPTRRARTTRKKTSMSRKSILNLTSRKKRNGMLNISNSSATGGTTTGANVGPLTVNAGTGGWVMWCATAQDLTDQNTTSGTVAEMAQRTATSCYMRGVSEHIRIQTSTSMPWFWRRIVFRVKANSAFNTLIAPFAGITGPYWDGSSGVERLLVNSLSQTVSQTVQINQQQAVLFKGQNGVDWTDPIIAPIDTTRVTLMYDKTCILRSGNQLGTIKESKLWHGMNHNLVYDDDENGSTENSSYFSTSSKAGMGDVFVLDQFQSGTGGATSDLLQMTVNSTLYWHEK